ncbi:TPR repeat-containing protein [Caballeronia arationis]|uniref:Tetratricopeptide repeat-containing protein n=1 Tax=Caballeronia arationis TaxID=1777142 RepID=A0A7Z7I4T0_9BURK|nr:tetratricopeptide repeat protein [Caballeronia arationis]SAL07491.1 TPR repeat-containing protein [Caballeronia arationis]SOE62771.1 Tetratricopeptide repeat-containing protein [Caballeronia arationis]
MTGRNSSQDYSLRSLQSLLGVSRSVLTGLMDAGFVQPTRGRRNELRFTFQDVVVLRTAFQLQAAKISSRKILRALSRLKSQLPDELPLSGIRITAVGDRVAVTTGPSQWDADSGQLLLDFEVAPIKGDVTFLDSTPRNLKNREQQAAEWFALAEQLTGTDVVGAEQAYRKVLELAPTPHYSAYTNLGVLLCEAETRCEDALTVFERALEHFPRDALLHFNRAVVLEELKRYDAAAQAYERCLELDASHADAHFNLARLSEIRGDKQGLVRHLSAYRRLSG